MRIEGKVEENCNAHRFPKVFLNKIYRIFFLPELGRRGWEEPSLLSFREFKVPLEGGGGCNGSFSERVGAFILSGGGLLYPSKLSKYPGDCKAVPPYLQYPSLTWFFAVREFLFLHPFFGWRKVYLRMWCDFDFLHAILPPPSNLETEHVTGEAIYLSWLK